MVRSSILVLAILSLPSLAHATPGPDSVVVVANANVPESMALAQRYVSARDVPASQLCALDLPDVDTIDLADYETRLLTPLRTCLDTSGARARIEAAVLIRGVPLRVDIPVPDGDGTEVVSTAAALMLWDSELDGGASVLTDAPGRRADCGGTSCYAARWMNPYRGFVFEPGWTSMGTGVTWRPILVTMLHGRSYAAAEQLLDSALAAETALPTGTEFVFMDGADSARGALDIQYDSVIAALTTRGFAARRVPFDRDLVPLTLAGFMVGTANIGETIEGNTYAAGSIVDNLTSFGAVPRNFEPTGESQVSIARWVEQGVAGVHGTVAEPLNNSFPNRQLVVQYVDGATLAEAFHVMMPFTYWRNLVLGDPMAAPYAIRPDVTLGGVTDGARLTGATTINVTADDRAGRGIESIVAYLDGVEVARSDTGSLEHCLFVETGDDHQLLIVSRAAPDPTDARIWQPKGWVAVTLDSDGGSMSCAPRGVDGGAMFDDGGVPRTDAGADGGGGTGDGGCACRIKARAARGASSFGPASVFLALVLMRRRRNC